MYLFEKVKQKQIILWLPMQNVYAVNVLLYTPGRCIFRKWEHLLRPEMAVKRTDCKMAKTAYYRPRLSAF